MTLSEFQFIQNSLGQNYRLCATILKQWESKRLPNGLTPDHVRALPEWKAAKQKTDFALAALRAFNGNHAAKFKKETRLAIEATVKMCGVDLSQDIGGVGDGAMEDALKAIACAMGHDSAQILKAHG